MTAVASECASIKSILAFCKPKLRSGDIASSMARMLYSQHAVLCCTIELTCLSRGVDAVLLRCVGSTEIPGPRLPLLNCSRYDKSGKRQGPEEARALHVPDLSLKEFLVVPFSWLTSASLLPRSCL